MDITHSSSNKRNTRWYILHASRLVTLLPKTRSCKLKVSHAGYINGILYQLCWPVSRISLVLLYQRVFVKVWFKYACWFLIGSYTLFAISMTITQIFTTVPINAQWRRTTPKQKINTDQFLAATNIFNVITDVLLLVMPLAIVWRLKVKTLTRVGLSFVFSLGCLTLLASIMRLYTTYKYKKSRDPECASP